MEINGKNLYDYEIEELHGIVRVTTSRIRELERQLRYDFGVGDCVSFTTPKYGTIKGRVNKINAKTIGVVANVGRQGFGIPTRWRVAPSYLTKISPEELVEQA